VARQLLTLAVAVVLLAKLIILKALAAQVVVAVVTVAVAVVAQELLELLILVVVAAQDVMLVPVVFKQAVVLGVQVLQLLDILIDMPQPQIQQVRLTYKYTAGIEFIHSLHQDQ
jgi:hypothetical protein